MFSRYYSHILFMLISIFVVTLYVNGFGPINRLQRFANDLLCSFTATNSVSSNVSLIVIDERAEKEYGAWPWNHDLVADLLAAAANGEPKSLLVDLELSEDAAQDSAGFTKVLAEQLQTIPQAVLSYDISLANYRSEKTSNPDDLFHTSLQVDNPLGVTSEEAGFSVRKVFMPADRLIAHKPRLGFDYFEPDDDRELRHHTMFMHFEGYYYPSQTLMAAAAFFDLKADQLVVVDGKAIDMAQRRKIPIDSRGRYYIRFSEGSTYPTFSAAEILSDSFDRSRLKGKALVVGVQSPEFNETYSSPVPGQTTSLVTKASVLDNIISDMMVGVQGRNAALDMLILFMLGGLGAFILPRITIGFRMVVLVGGLIILANINYFLFTSWHLLPDTMFIALELLLFMLAAPALDMEVMAASRPETSSAKSKRRTSTENYSARARTTKQDFRNSPENIPTTAIAYDKTKNSSGGFSKTEIYDHSTIKGDSPIGESTNRHETERDPQAVDLEKMEQSSKPSPVSHSVSPLGVPSSAANESPAMDDSGRLPGQLLPSDIKNLGRYQISGVLGKGAMGLVYKGIDPAINRPVALKTIRLDFCNDPHELAELKERLTREAQAAGKLSHPNIVTIYDVGSEGPLQYIAMEYLEGQTLEQLIKRKTKFNYKIIAQIIREICSALEYAHERGIVHRDIKPANIMVLPNYSVKVMDYGIARIDSHSMTKTGIAMGTPNYISPEQLKGLTTDRRSDLFSLGVVMYEMLLGRRPFKGESITSLIYAIINHEPEKPSNVNPQIPLLFDHITMKALKKDPSQRYQRASEVSIDLGDFIASFASRTV